jgi:hypothetical protein
VRCGPTSGDIPLLSNDNVVRLFTVAIKLSHKVREGKPCMLPTSS